MRRVLEYLAVFVLAAAVFVATSALWSGPVPVLIAAVGASAVAVAAWWWWSRRTAPAPRLDVPQLGVVPDHSGSGPAPSIAEPGGIADQAYAALADAVDGLHDLQVLVVTSPGPGQGATTTALNLAAAASRAGRRVLLIDADRASASLSAFNGTGLEPGLYDIATGSAGLEEAARMWDLGGSTRMPMIPIGSRTGTEADLASPHLAGVIDRVAERADLILVDAPSAAFDGVPAQLAAHADGSILVLPPSGPRAAVDRAVTALEDIGAPVVGYVVNRGRVAAAPSGWRVFRRVAATAMLLLAGYTAWTGVSIWAKWLGVERVQVDTVAAREQIAATTGGSGNGTDPDGSIDVTALDPAVAGSLSSRTPIEGEYFETFLILGTDSRSPDQVSGRADVIMLVLVPQDGSTPGMVSIPRDLFLPNACTSGFSRINAGLNGCRDSASGIELISINIEDFTGVQVDHVALFDFDGFEEIIDAVGGIRICTENPIRSAKASLDFSLPAGCDTYDGETTLKWVRDRATQELVDGVWRTVPGVNDLARNQRQQDVVLQMFSKMQRMRDPGELATVVGELSDAFTLGESVGIGEAVSLAWSMRDLGADGFSRFTIPVTGHVTSTGAQVLLPTSAFADLLIEEFPSWPAPSAAGP